MILNLTFHIKKLLFFYFKSVRGDFSFAKEKDKNSFFSSHFSIFKVEPEKTAKRGHSNNT